MNDVLWIVASLLGLILAVCAGMLFAHLGLHGLPGIMASALTGIVIALLMAFFFTRKTS